MLAASARRGGHRTIVLDCFADRDTRALADAVRNVGQAGTPRLDRRSLLSASREFSSGVAGLVVGSGLESRPALLAGLATTTPLLGNLPETVHRAKDPDHFFPLLARLGAPAPEVRRTAPPDPEAWLLKQTGGAGGTHIRAATHRAPPRDGYFQRRAEGVPHSVLFLADGRSARRIGISRQWTAGRPRTPFLYGGAAGGVRLPDDLLARLDRWLEGLVAALGLVGLNGLDFLLDGAEPLVLELNPRPTATMELYDPEWPRGLFDAHLDACRGQLPASVPAARASRSAATLFAPVAARLDAAFEFPAWCTDLPMPGTDLAAGDPVCTIHAGAADPAAARAAVEARCATLTDALLSAAPCR